MGTRYMFGRKNVTACRFLLIVSGVTLLLVGLIIRNIHEESRLQHHVRENILASDVISETEAEQQLTRLSSLLTKFSTDKQTALIHKFQASLNSSWVLAHQPPTRNGTRDMLPGTMVHPSAWVKYNIKWRGLTLPVLTCEPLGRLGNVMGEYATLYALAHIYNVSVVIHPKMKNQLQDHFPYTSLPDLPGNYTPNKWRQLSKIGSLYNYALVEVAASGLLGPHTFIIKEYPFEIQLFNQFKKDLQREFTFAPEYTARAQLFLLNITEERRKEELDPIFIGFHIRQTDYAQHVKVSS
ncbi:galactoside alpha-(1,2)-fucosyltransferase 1 [Cherax quadricarinatus]|uniref:galactoside alpha-(1,2)-fucosyltransferase 1 n=1 Tax=Cherax quadricarinatus TaxID=27406 RepID=UPI00387E2C3E